MSSIVRVLEKNRDLVKSAIINFLRKKKEELKSMLDDVERELNEFRTKYGDLEEYESKLPDDFNSHEVWFEWKKLVRIREEILAELKEIDRAIKEITTEI